MTDLKYKQVRTINNNMLMANDTIQLRAFSNQVMKFFTFKF